MYDTKILIQTLAVQKEFTLCDAQQTCCQSLVNLMVLSAYAFDTIRLPPLPRSVFIKPEF